MSDYLSDKEQVEMVKKWWNDYGKALLLAVIVGLFIGFLWRTWGGYEAKQAVKASAIYQLLLEADEKNQFTNAQGYAQTLVQHYERTPYAAMANFVWAKEAVSQKDYATAYEKLQWIIKNSHVKSYRHLAMIRAAGVLLEQKKFQVALDLLSAIKESEFQPMIDSVKGDAYMGLGKIKEAQAAYSTANQGMQAVGVSDPILQMKLAR